MNANVQTLNLLARWILGAVLSLTAPGTSTADATTNRAAGPIPSHHLDKALRLVPVLLRKDQIEISSRHLADARALLSPWWQHPEPPAGILFLRARLRQRNHEFDAAEADLAQLLRENPAHLPALLTLFTIRQTAGDHDGMRELVVRVRRVAPPLTAAIVTAIAESLTGRARESYERLLHATATGAGSRAEQQWARATLAEIAVRLGESADASAHFREALALGEPDKHLLADYADHLLAGNRHREVMALLEKHRRDRPLLLRHARAARALGLTERADIYERVLRREFNRPTGDHPRYSALYHLWFTDDRQAALSFATKNWDRQKEPFDALLLLRAAGRSGNEEVAHSVRLWMRKHRLQDQRINLIADAEASGTKQGPPPPKNLQK